MTHPSDQSIRLDIDGRIARITLDRPKQHNALRANDVAAFKAAVARAEGSDSARVLIVAGSGSSTFCSGAALGQMKTGEMNGEIFETLTDRLASVRLPTICALNGSVYGGGAEIALSCDFRIGVAGSRLSVPAARLGICYPQGGLRRYVERLGLATACRILVAAEELDADEMYRTGFLTHLVEPAALEEAVSSLARQIADLAPLAVQTMKKILRDVAAGTSDAGEARRLVAACAASADAEEGLRAHDEGRAPKFEGR